MPRGPKITYTYNGITFSTASKVVAERAAAGNLAGAYKRYLSDTLGRELRAGHQSIGMRQMYLRSVESGIISQAEASEKSKLLENEVSKIIASRMEHQYQDVLAQLKGSKNPEIQKLAGKVEQAIAVYSDKYRPEDAIKANRAIMRIINRAEKKFQRGEISEDSLRELQNVSATVESIRSQISIKDKMRSSRLKQRRKSRVKKKKEQTKRGRKSRLKKEKDQAEKRRK